MSTTQRGYVGALIDRLGHNYLGFPPERCSYTVTGVRIPITDGDEEFELVADVYKPVLPQDEQPAGTLLVRSPYGRGPMLSFGFARPYAARGYVVLAVSSRGTFGSGSTFDPWRNEEHDGHAVVDWMRKQDWYTGSFGTLGASYLGFVQWALLKNPPSDMVAAVIQCAPHHFSKQMWGTGSLALEVIEWGEHVAHQEDSGLSHFLDAFKSKKRMRAVLDRTPLAESVKTHFNGSAPWLDYVVDHPDVANLHYEQMNASEALERANIPILLISGWDDLFASQSLEQYARLSERKTNVAFTIGPWNHMQSGMDAKTGEQTFDWLQVHVAKRKTSTRKAPVQYFVTGAQEWREGPTWPPPTKHQTFYVHSESRLDSNVPASDEKSSSTFIFDPKTPTPTMGGNLLMGGGSANDTALASRPDVLTFTTKPLEDNLEICGPITVELSHSSDNPSVDLFVRISEVNAKGISHSVTDTYSRLPPRRDDQSITLQLRDCAHRFAKGSRVRFILAGASYPQYAMPLEKATHTIHHGRNGPSKILLPAVVI